MPIIEYEIDTLDIIRAAVASNRTFAPLEPMTRSHEMVERITTKEYPYKLTLMDEETQGYVISLSLGPLVQTYPQTPRNRDGIVPTVKGIRGITVY